MTQDELIAALAPIRIPINFAEFTFRDGLLAVALGLFAGLLLAKIASLFTARRITPRDQARLEIASLSSLKANARLVGLTKLLTRYDQNGPTGLGLKGALYDPTVSIDPEVIEQAILAAAGSKK